MVLGLLYFKGTDVKKIIKHLFIAILATLMVTCCFSLLACNIDIPGGNTGNNGENNGNNGGNTDTPNEDNENNEDKNFVDYTLKSLTYSVSGMGDYYIDVENMSATDHATYDSIILTYGKHVYISSNQLKFVDGSVLSVYGTVKYTLDGETVTLLNDALASTFNFVKLSNGKFSIGISQEMAGNTVTCSFDYYAKTATTSTYTVSFDSMGGESVAAQTVKKGGVAQRPSDPQRSGFIFIGWFTDINFSKEYNFSTQVLKDITLYAKWEPNGNSGTPGEDDEDKDFVGYTLKSFTYSVSGLDDYYVDINDMSATDHETFDSIVSMYGKHVNISSNHIKFVDGSVLSSYGTIKYTINGETVTLLNISLASSFNNVKLSNGVFSIGILQVMAGGVVSYTFDYCAPNAILPSYTVSFDCMGGENVAAQKVQKGGFAKKPSAPYRHGYTFDKWYVDEEYSKEYDFSTHVIKDITLYAKWIPLENTVTFETYGGTYVREQTVESGNKIYTPYSPQKVGYTFDGWYADSEFKTAWDFDTLVYENLTLHAKYNPKTYTLTFNLLGGVCETTSKSVTYNAEIGEMPVPERQGFVFDGWYEQQVGGIAFKSSTIYNVAKDYQLYARWLTTITLDADEAGTLEKTQVRAAYKQLQRSIEVLPSPIPINSGISFTGWYTEPGGKGLFHDNDYHYNFEEPVTLYASYIIGISFDSAGGSHVSNILVTKGNTFEPETPRRTGYTFEGWYDETGARYDETTVINRISELYLTAKWTANKITFRFNAQGGSLISNRIYTYDSPLEELPTTQKEGNVFCGWYSYIGGRGNKYDETTICKSTSTITLYAKWTATVTFDYLGATSDNEQEAQQFVYNTAIDIVLPQPYKTGWSFEGWFSQQNGQGTQLTNNALLYPFSTEWNLSGDTTFYAYWVKGTDKRYLSYTTASSGITITGLKDTAIKNLEIPSIINLSPVTAIKQSAFANTGLTTVTVPDTVTTIGEGAFKGCALTEISLPFVGESRTARGVTQVFGYIFGYTYINSNYETIEGAIFQYENGSYRYWYYIPATLEKVTITDVTVIPEKAFNSCTMLKEVTLNGNVTTVNASAFSECSNLTTLNGIESLENINDFAFRNCKNLLNFPTSALKVVGQYSFYNCINLSEVTFSEELQSIGGWAFVNTSITQIELKNGLQSIGAYAFENTGLTTVTVPDTVTTIGEGAFKGCALTEISLPFVGESRTARGVTQVFGYIFGYTYINSNYETIEGAIFQYENGSYRYWYYIPATLEKVTITDVTVIPKYAFNNCKTIKEITFTSNITSVYEGAFRNTQVEVLRFEGSLTGTVDAAAFTNLSQNVTIIVPDEFIEDYKTIFTGYNVIGKSEQQ